MTSLGFDRPRVFGDTTRDKVLSVYWQLRSNLIDGPGLEARWEQYIIDIFKGLQKDGLPSIPGAFLGIAPQAVGNTAGAWVFKAHDAKIGALTSGEAVVTYTLEFRYVFKLPGRIDYHG